MFIRLDTSKNSVIRIIINAIGFFGNLSAVLEVSCVEARESGLPVFRGSSPGGGGIIWEGGGRAEGNSPPDLVEVIPLAASCGFLAACFRAFCRIFLASVCRVGIFLHLVGGGAA